MINQKRMLVILLFFQSYLFAQDKTRDLFSKSYFTSGIEGSSVDENGNVYVVNFHHEGSIGIISPNNEPALFIDLPNGSIGNGTRILNKNMYVADYTQHKVWEINLLTKEIKTYASCDSCNQPNDLAITSSGGIYLSDPNWKNGTGNIWFINSDRIIKHLEYNCGTTNGIEVSPDNKTLYVNESVQKVVWKYDIQEDGSITNKKELIRFKDAGLDGMRCDNAGNLYVARYDAGVIAVVSANGKLISEIKLTGKKPTNVAFGGKKGRTLYVTLQDRGLVEFVKVPFSGREWLMNNK